MNYLMKSKKVNPNLLSDMKTNKWREMKWLNAFIWKFDFNIQKLYNSANSSQSLFITNKLVCWWKEFITLCAHFTSCRSFISVLSGETKTAVITLLNID